MVTHRDHQQAVAILYAPGQGVVNCLPLIQGADLQDCLQILEGLFLVPGVCCLVVYGEVVTLVVEVADAAAVQVDPQRGFIVSAAVGGIQHHEGVVPPTGRTHTLNYGRNRSPVPCRTRVVFCSPASAMPSVLRSTANVGSR